MDKGDEFAVPVSALLLLLLLLLLEVCGSGKTTGGGGGGAWNESVVCGSWGGGGVTSSWEALLVEDLVRGGFFLVLFAGGGGEGDGDDSEQSDPDDLPESLPRRLRHEVQRFLMPVAARPLPTTSAILVHTFPSRLCASMMARSSSGVHGVFTTHGSMWFRYRSLHCFPMRPVPISSAMCVHRLVLSTSNLATSSSNCLSSSGVQLRCCDDLVPVAALAARPWRLLCLCRRVLATVTGVVGTGLLSSLTTELVPRDMVERRKKALCRDGRRTGGRTRAEDPLWYSAG